MVSMKHFKVNGLPFTVTQKIYDNYFIFAELSVGSLTQFGDIDEYIIEQTIEDIRKPLSVFLDTLDDSNKTFTDAIESIEDHLVIIEFADKYLHDWVLGTFAYGIWCLDMYFEHVCLGYIDYYNIKLTTDLMNKFFPGLFKLVVVPSKIDIDKRNILVKIIDHTIIVTFEDVYQDYGINDTIRFVMTEITKFICDTKLSFYDPRDPYNLYFYHCIGDPVEFLYNIFIKKGCPHRDPYDQNVFWTQNKQKAGDDIKFALSLR